jgi:hypothetical protein
MTVKTEKQHTGEFLISEGEGTISREKGTLLSGQNLKDGTVLQLTTGKLKGSEGASGEVIVGIIYGDHDATAGDLANVPYIARLAEVDATLVYAAEVSGATVNETELNALNIYLR